MLNKLLVFLSLLFWFVFSSPVFSQLYQNNILLESRFERLRYNFLNLYARHTADSLQIQNKHGQRDYGVDVIGGYRNSALDYYSVYNDNAHFLFSPYINGKFHENVSFKFRFNVENVKDELVDANKPFWADDLRNFRGGVEIGAITWKHDKFQVKFGRDFLFLPVVTNENLLFSNFNYPYDQLKLEYRNKDIAFSAYYLRLNSTRENGVIFNRHLNGHRLSINLFGKGYFAINEVILYGGENRNVNFLLLNPFIGYYVFQKNDRNFESNTLISTELFYQHHRLFAYVEFLLDDFQIDKEVSSDLEPNEFGYNITFGVKDIAPGLHWSLNHTKVANRTYNAPDQNYEKYIYKNYPIGHFAGNNFWEMKTSVRYEAGSRFMTDLDFFYREFGDEALYSEFNKIFLNFSVDQGYNEKFPFGEIRKQAGIVSNTFLTIGNNVTANLRFSYWFKKSFLKHRFNYSLNLAFHY